MTISRDDLEAKAREIMGVVDQTRQSAKDTAMIAGIAVAAVVVFAFIYGRRRGGRNKTLVEVYRV